jgi:hypothetical protein
MPVELEKIATGDNSPSTKNARAEQIVAVVRHGCHSASWYAVAQEQVLGL